MRRPVCFASLIVAAVVFLFLRAFPVQQLSYEKYDGQVIFLTGRVTSKEYRRNAAGTWTLAVALKEIGTGEAPDGFPFPQDHAEYRVLCILESEAEQLRQTDERTAIGSRIRVCGTLRSFPKATNPGEFDSRLYYQILQTEFRLLHIRILGTAQGADPFADRLYRLKRGLCAVLDRCCTQRDAGVLKAMLLGEKGFLDTDLKDLYSQAGIVHILAISGLHITLLGMGLFRILRKIRLPLPAAAAAAVTAMVLYGLMTGMGGSVFRAVFMFGMRLTARLLGRTYDLLTAVTLAGLLLLLSQPLYLYHSGFLFSFGAVLSIGLLLPALPGKAGRACAVPLVNLPVYLSFYYTFPLYSILLNLAVIPLMSLLMVSALAALAAGSLWIPAGRAAGLGAHALLYCFESLCRLTSSLPGSSLILGKPYTPEMILYFAMLVLLVLFSERFEGKIYDGLRRGGRDLRADRRMRRRIAAAKTAWTALAVAVLTLRFSGGLTVSFLDVGQGDGIYIESDGFRITIDGGSSSKTQLGKYQLMPFLKCRAAGTVDLAVLTHDDSDHCSGLISLLESGYRIRQVALPFVAENLKGENYRKIEQLAAQRGIPVLYLQRGEKLERGRLTLCVLHPAVKDGKAEAYET